jgi:hypothetical protein
MRAIGPVAVVSVLALSACATTPRLSPEISTDTTVGQVTLAAACALHKYLAETPNFPVRQLGAWKVTIKYTLGAETQDTISLSDVVWARPLLAATLKLVPAAESQYTATRTQLLPVTYQLAGLRDLSSCDSNVIDASPLGLNYSLYALWDAVYRLDPDLSHHVATLGNFVYTQKFTIKNTVGVTPSLTLIPAPPPQLGVGVGYKRVGTDTYTLEITFAPPPEHPTPEPTQVIVTNWPDQ